MTNGFQQQQAPTGFQVPKSVPAQQNGQRSHALPGAPVHPPRSFSPGRA